MFKDKAQGGMRAHGVPPSIGVGGLRHRPAPHIKAAGSWWHPAFSPLLGASGPFCWLIGWIEASSGWWDPHLLGLAATPVSRRPDLPPFLLGPGPLWMLVLGTSTAGAGSWTH